MGFLSRFEGRMEDTVEGAADKMAGAPLSPVQIAKKAEKQMRREKMVGAGKQYAPTLYTVLVNPDDDERLFGYYPTLAGETETYLSAKAMEHGLVMDGQPLVRFIVDDDLKHGKFDVIAEAVAAPIVEQLRAEEMQRYGIAPAPARSPRGARGGRGGYPQAAERGYGEPVPRAMRGGYPPMGGYDEPAPDADDGYPLAEDYAAQAPAGVDGGYPPAAGIGAAAGAAAFGAVAARPQAPARAANTVVFAGGQPDQAPRQGGQPAAARLINTVDNRSYTLGASRLSVGRESKNDIVVSDINASRTHAELTCDAQGTWYITDLGSTNGTLVNGYETASQPLEEGDRITIGTTNFVFTYGG